LSTSRRGQALDQNASIFRLNAPQPIPYSLMEAMRRAIINGRYTPGQPLREETLEAE
jgi:DNA-binding GntR family transcriptional regulator